MPEVKHKKYTFPKQYAFATADVKRPFEKLGAVRAKADYNTLDPNHEPDALCKNYYNKAVQQLVRIARKKMGADAVIDIRSVVFLADGRVENYHTPECVDEGDEGEVLVAGIAVKWKPEEPGAPAPSPSASPSPSISPPPPTAPLAEPEQLKREHFPAVEE